MRISFDIDGVLDTEAGQLIAQRAIDRGDDVFIITARNEERASAEVYEIAQKLNIPRLRVYFTNGADKWRTIDRLDIDLHYDNSLEQIDKIEEFTNASARLFDN
jgi:acid phosphatase class B